MTDDQQLDTYFDPLTQTDREALQARMDRYRDRLEAEGYDVTIADGEHGFFAGVLVIDDQQGRFGFLDPDGSVNWLTGGLGGIGALGSAVAQNPTERLEEHAEDADAFDIE
jgi:hypothetical protein